MTRGMIEARTASAGLAARLPGKAERLAAAHAETQLHRRRRDPRRWRLARLIWPLFAKER